MSGHPSPSSGSRVSTSHDGDAGDAWCETLDELPPSAKLVHYALRDAADALTQSQLREMTHLSPRTIRDALSRLESHDLVEERLFIPDARKRLYALDHPVSETSAPPSE